nr:asparagine synthase-related protein [uncultured Draconibacterium sp.]
MSVLFGIFYKDGRSVSNELSTIYAGLKHFPHEKCAFEVEGNCGFGHMLTYNTPEAVNESMPKWIEEAHVLFVAEGRIDNRDDLFQLLDIQDEKQAIIPDGDLIFKAYQKWGEKCVDRLLGKWSLAAFNTGTQKLFIACDKWDYTSIDYYVDDKVFAFSTSSKGLFPLPFITKEIDELKIARQLVVWQGDAERTYFKGIRRLLPSHTLCVTPKKLEIRRYWNPADICVKEGLKLEDYVEDLFCNLRKAVECRLRSYKPVAATLSGGLDSSTVCVLAAEYLKKEGKHLRTYTHVPQFSPSGSLSKYNFGDERPFVDAIVKFSGNMDPAYLESEKLSPIAGIRKAVQLYGEPFHGAGNAYWLVDIFNTAVQENYGTMLMGEFGNATTSWGGNADALPSNEIIKRYGVKGFMKKKILKPILYGETPLAHIYKRTVYGRKPWRNRSCCSEAFENSLNLAERIEKSGFDPTFKRYFANPKEQKAFTLDVNVLRLCYGAYLGCETGIEFRDPLGDPRVIESALAIPNEMFFGEQDKWVLRTMMKGRLPDVVRLNTKKGKQSSDLPARLCVHKEEMDDILKEMEFSGFGRIVDMERIRKIWEKIQAEPANYPVKSAFCILKAVAIYVMMYEMS